MTENFGIESFVFSLTQQWHILPSSGQFGDKNVSFVPQQRQKTGNLMAVIFQIYNFLDYEFFPHNYVQYDGY